MTFIIRKLKENDFSNWKLLWSGYLEFYKTNVVDIVYHTTFKRLISKYNTSQKSFVADQNDELIGLVHFIYHPHNWKVEDVCYLQDLFVAPDIRGNGVGRALIEAVYLDSDQRKSPKTINNKNGAKNGAINLW